MKKLKLITVGLTLAGLVPIGAGIPASAHAAPVATAVQAASSSEPLSCRVPGETAVKPSELALSTQPEKMLDANGVAAKSYAGFFTGQSIVTDGTSSYVAFYDENKKLTVGSRTGTTGPWTFINPQNGSKQPEILKGDTHNNAAMTMGPDGTLHLIANVHSSEMSYWRSVSPSDPLNFVFSRSLVSAPRHDSEGVRIDIEANVTYPKFFTGEDGVFRLMWRQGWSDAGQTYVYEYDSATERWSNPLGTNAVLNGWNKLEGNHSPYPNDIQYNPADGFYYLSYTWQGRSDAAATSTINLIRTRDFTSWTSGTGKPVPSPVTFNVPNAIVEAVPENSGLLNSNVKTGFDNTGKPTVTYVRDIDSGTAVSVARLNAKGSDWKISTLTPWTGKTDYTDPTKLTQVLLASGTVPGSSNLTIPYSCGDQVRDLIVTDGDSSGATTLVSNLQKSKNVLPQSLTKTEFPDDKFKIIYRTETTQWARGSVIMKWEAGPMIANNAVPDPQYYPKGGSTLLFATTGEKPGTKKELELSTQPEKMLDANGVAAKAFAGFYTDQAVVTRGDTTFVAFYAADRTLTVAQRTGTTGPWTFDTPRDAAGKQVLLTGDTRSNIAMSIDSIGQLHIVANVNSSAMNYWRSVSPSEPTNLVFANSLVIPAQFNDKGVRTDGEGYVSYPRFLTDQNDVLRLSFRSGWVNAGMIFAYEFNTGTGRWSNPVGAGTPVLNGWGTTGNPSFGPLTDQFQYNPADGHYYLSYTWQGNGTVASAHSVNMIRTKDFKSWFTGLGAPISMPVLHDTPAVVVAPVPENSGLLNSNIKTGFDNTGKPTVVYTHDFKDKTAVSVARMNQARKGWVISTLTPWQEKIDLTNPQNFTKLLLNSGTTRKTPNLTVSYAYKGEVRELTIGDGNGIGRSVLISDQTKVTDVMPESLTKQEFPNAGYKIFWRTASANSDAGTVIVKWEAGAMIANGTDPDPKSYPKEGSTLFIAVAKK